MTPETLGEASPLTRFFFAALVSVCKGSLVAGEADIVLVVYENENESGYETPAKLTFQKLDLKIDA